MKVEIRPSLTYESFSREAAVSRLEEDGVVSVRLSPRQMSGAVRFISKFDDFNQALAKQESVARLFLKSALTVWSVSLLALLHGKLVGLVPFVVLNKPHSWCAEVGPDGVSCLQFLALR